MLKVHCCVVFSTNSVDDILLLLTFICSIVSSVHNVRQDELEELKVCFVMFKSIMMRDIA